LEAVVTELTPLLCSIPNAARLIGRGTTFIYEEISAGRIAAVKSDKRTLVVVNSLREYAANLPAAKPSVYREYRRRTRKKVA
jgi:hypothetical protein